MIYLCHWYNKIFVSLSGSDYVREVAQTDILHSAYQRAARYVDELNQRRVYPDDEAIAALEQLDEPLPLSPSEPRASLDLLDRIGSPATVASSGPRYFGYVVGGAQLSTIAANWLASAWDQNAATSNLSPVNVAIEKTTSRWILELLDLPRGAHCSFLTGTTAAHIAALTTARTLCWSAWAGTYARKDFGTRRR